MNISVANSALIEHNGHFKTKVTILSHFTHIFMKEADLRLLTTMQLAIYCLLKVRKPPLKTSEALLGPVSSINGTKRLFFCIFCVKFLKTINLFVVGSMLTEIEMISLSCESIPLQGMSIGLSIRPSVCL